MDLATHIIIGVGLAPINILLGFICWEQFQRNNHWKNPWRKRV